MWHVVLHDTDDVVINITSQAAQLRSPVLTAIGLVNFDEIWHADASRHSPP